MEAKEHRHENCHYASKNVANLNEEAAEQEFSVAGRVREIECVQLPLDCQKKLIAHGYGDIVGGQEHIDQEKEEVFAVPEADAIVDPGAVMIHVEDASVAG